MRPRSIELFEKVYLASIVLGLIGLALSWTAVEERARTQVGEAAAMVTSALAFGALLGIVIPLLLLYFIARRASNVAKWIFVALTLLGLFTFLSGLVNTGVPRGPIVLLSVVNMALTLYAAWLLFRPDAKAWLESRGSGRGP